MKTKLGNADPVRVSPVRAISAFSAVPPAMLYATIANTEPRVGLCLQAKRNQLHYLLQQNYLQSTAVCSFHVSFSSVTHLSRLLQAHNDGLEYNNMLKEVNRQKYVS
jgi:hypothetical protein